MTNIKRLLIESIKKDISHILDRKIDYRDSENLNYLTNSINIYLGGTS